MATAPCFYVKQGERNRTQINLERFPFTIGRARECDYVIDSSDISRLHIRLELHHQQVVLRDLGSTNGTYLNGEAVQPNRDYRLRANDTVNLAGICVLIFDDPSTTAITPPEMLPRPGLRLDIASAQVFIGNRLVDPPLSPSQILLLEFLIQNEDNLVSREAVWQYVWGNNELLSDQTLDALVSRLRKRLKEFDPEHDYVVTRRGFGLMFNNRPQVISYR